jgi:hypothetical protein
MKIFEMVIFLVLLSFAESPPLKFDVPLIEVTPAIYTKATENLELSTEDSAYWEIVSVDDDLALHSSVSSFKDGLLNFVPTLAPLVLETNSTTTVSLAPVSSAFKDDYDDLANDTVAFQLDRFSNDYRISELSFKMEAVTLNPWEIVKLLWTSVDTPVAVGAAFFVGRYY